MVDIPKSLVLKKNQKKKRYCYRDCRDNGFSATQNNDKIGLILFSDEIELHSAKKRKVACIENHRELIEFQPRSRKRSSASLEILSGTQKRKHYICDSDFMSEDYENTLKIAAKKT
jgi:predicted nuclease of restriction endonuclease-like (RecB) superfamily